MGSVRDNCANESAHIVRTHTNLHESFFFAPYLLTQLKSFTQCVHSLTALRSYRYDAQCVSNHKSSIILNVMPLHKSESNCKRSSTPNAAVPRLTSIRELMHLEEQRMELEASLSDVRVRMSQLQSSLVSSLTPQKNAAFSQPREHITAPAPTEQPPAARLPRIIRGHLRTQILAALLAVGPEGISVPDLARSLGMKPVNVHSWFHSARKRIPEIKKNGPGRYCLIGIPNCLSQPEPKIIRQRDRSQTRAPRGETTRRIMEVFAAEGGRAMAVSEIAAKIGVHNRNVHVWLSSTGKKNPKIVRSGRGTYQMVQPPQPPSL